MIPSTPEGLKRQLAELAHITRTGGIHQVTRIECHRDDFALLLASLPSSRSAHQLAVIVAVSDTCLPCAARCYDSRGRFLRTIDLNALAGAP